MADFYANALLTATNATIIVDGLSVGDLSELSFQQRYNVQEFVPVGSSVPRAFVTGAYSSAGTISKAYIDMNLILDQLKPSLDAMSADAYYEYTQLKNEYKNLPSDEQDKAIIDLASPLQKLKDANTDVLELDRRAGTHLAKRFLQTSFDIEIRGPIADQAGEIKEDGQYFVLKDCSITSRTFSMAAASVIVLSDISFVFKDVYTG